MSSSFGQAQVPVGSDSGFHADQAFAQLSHRTGGELPEVPDGEPSMFPPDLNEAGEREVVANEDLRAGHQASREGFVMRVPQSYDPAVTILGELSSWADFEDPEVAIALVADCMGLSEQVKACIGELAFYLLDQMAVREWEPSVGCPGRLDIKELTALNDLASTVEEHGVSGGWPFSRGWRHREDVCLPGASFFDQVDHGIPFVGCFLPARSGREMVDIELRVCPCSIVRGK